MFIGPVTDRPTVRTGITIFLNRLCVIRIWARLRAFAPKRLFHGHVHIIIITCFRRWGLPPSFSRHLISVQAIGFVDARSFRFYNFEATLRHAAATDLKARKVGRTGVACGWLLARPSPFSACLLCVLLRLADVVTTPTCQFRRKLSFAAGLPPPAFRCGVEQYGFRSASASFMVLIRSPLGVCCTVCCCG